MAHGVDGSIFEAFVLGVRDQYAKDANAPDVKPDAWKVGRLKSKGQVAPPSLRFRRLGGTVQPTSRNGPFPFTNPDGSEVYFASAYEDLANVEVQIRAKDWLQLECVWTGFLTAARDVLGTMSVPGNYDHASESTADDESDSDFQKGGQLLIQQMQWTILIPQVSGSLVEINRVLGTSQFININAAPGTAGPSTNQT